MNLWQCDSTLTRELTTLSLYSMQEKPQNNGRIRNSEIFRAGSKHMWAVDGKQRIYLECTALDICIP